MNELDAARARINEIDEEMLKLFEYRMAEVRRIGEYKKQCSLPIRDKKREQQMLKRYAALLSDISLLPYYRRFLEGVIDASCEYQQNEI